MTTQSSGGNLPIDTPPLSMVAQENASDRTGRQQTEMPDESGSVRDLTYRFDAEELPILTEVVAPTTEDISRSASDATYLQPLLQRLELHLETVFTHRLDQHLKQMQRQAIEQAIMELEAELPRMLREVLKPDDAQ